MDDKAADEGVSAKNNGDASDNNDEAEEINNNPVRKPGFSYPEKHVLQYITNTPPLDIQSLFTNTPPFFDVAISKHYSKGEKTVFFRSGKTGHSIIVY